MSLRSSLQIGLGDALGGQVRDLGFEQECAIQKMSSSRCLSRAKASPKAVARLAVLFSVMWFRKRIFC